MKEFKTSKVEGLSETKSAEAFLKEVAIKFFYWWYNTKGNNTEQGFDDWIKEEGKKYVDQLAQFKSPSVVEQKWISVMDRLPEKDGPVIINDTDSLTPVKCLNFEDGRFTFKAYGTSLDYTDHVNFWQPLPEPPRKSQPL